MIYQMVPLSMTFSDP